MVNYACAFSQSELNEIEIEWMIMLFISIMIDN